jgi:hypothetical protein
LVLAALILMISVCAYLVPVRAMAFYIAEQKQRRDFPAL